MTVEDTENMPPYDRRKWLTLLIEQREEEKKAIDKANGKGEGQDLMRMPTPGESHGMTDMEKLGIDPKKLARLGGPPKRPGGPPPSSPKGVPLAGKKA